MELDDLRRELAEVDREILRSRHASAPSLEIGTVSRDRRRPELLDRSCRHARAAAGAVPVPGRLGLAPWNPVMPTDDESAAARLRTAFDLFIAGERMMRQNLRRRHPDASGEEIDRLLFEWMRERPGAEHGDAEGKVVEWPRKSSGAT